MKYMIQTDKTIIVLLDGLYANGPVTALCRRYKWDFMIVLKDDCLPYVWEEFHGLGRPQEGQSLQHYWGNRRQDFRWVNQIEYGYGQYGRDQLAPAC